MQYYSWTRISAVNHRRSFPIFLREGAAVHRLQADSPTTFRKSAISFRKNIDCETFRNVAFLLVFPTANGECSTSCRQKVRFAMFSCYFLRIIRQSIQVLCPVFSRKVFFRGVEGSNKVWTSKTSLSVSRQDFVEHGGRVISAAKQPEILHVTLVVTNDLLSESPNSIFGTSFFPSGNDEFPPGNQ